MSAGSVVPGGLAAVDGVDLTGLLRWMDDIGLGEGDITDVEPVGGGTQNILVTFRRSDRVFVLRRPPLNAPSAGDRTIAREAQVLRALSGTDTPHPRLAAVCDDRSVIGAAFYLTDWVDGYCPVRELSPQADSTSVSFAIVDALAALGRVDPRPLMNEGFGRPHGWLERQADRWYRQLQSYQSRPGYSDEALGDVRMIRGWLESNTPNSWDLGVVHGDFHLGNLIVDRTSPRVAAIVDWELSTLGDPLLDLGHLLATWPRPSVPRPPRRRGLEEKPADDELRRRYEEKSGRSTANLDWYRTLACFRMAALLDGTYARACDDVVPRPVGDRFRTAAISMISQASRLIAHSRAG